MNIDIAPGRYANDAGPFIIRIDGAASIVAIADGAASWGAGIDASRFVTGALQRRWVDNPPDNADTLIGHVSDALALLPREIRDHEWGLTFSFIAVLAGTKSWQIVNCGWYRCIAVREGVASTIFRSRMWVDQQVEAGVLSPADARTHKLRDVYAGPLVGDKGAPQFERETIEVPDVLYVMSSEMMRESASPGPRQFQSAVALQEAAVRNGARPDPVIVLTLESR